MSFLSTWKNMAETDFLTKFGSDFEKGWIFWDDMNGTWRNNGTHWLWERARGSYPGPRLGVAGARAQDTGHSRAGWEVQCAVAPEETYEVPEGFLGHALSVTGTARARFPHRLTPLPTHTIAHKTHKPLHRSCHCIYSGHKALVSMVLRILLIPGSSLE